VKWCESEILLFESGYKYYRGDLEKIQKLVQTKTLAQVVDYYYKWKYSPRYNELKKGPKFGIYEFIAPVKDSKTTHTWPHSKKPYYEVSVDVSINWTNVDKLKRKYKKIEYDKKQEGDSSSVSSPSSVDVSPPLLPNLAGSSESDIDTTGDIEIVIECEERFSVSERSNRSGISGYKVQSQNNVLNNTNNSNINGRKYRITPPPSPVPSPILYET